MHDFFSVYNPCQSSPSWTILFPVVVVVFFTTLMCFDPGNWLFQGFFPVWGNFAITWKTRAQVNFFKRGVGVGLHRVTFRIPTRLSCRHSRSVILIEIFCWMSNEWDMPSRVSVFAYFITWVIRFDVVDLKRNHFKKGYHGHSRTPPTPLAP